MCEMMASLVLSDEGQFITVMNAEAIYFLRSQIHMSSFNSLFSATAFSAQQCVWLDCAYLPFFNPTPDILLLQQSH